jgi:hypothetical protein
MRTGNLTEEATRIATQRIGTVLEVLLRAGFTADAAMYAYSSLSVYTRGVLFLDRTWATSMRPREVGPGTFATLPGLDALADAGERHTLSMTGEEDFRFGLENAIRGLRLLLADLQGDEPCVIAARRAGTLATT